MFGKNKSRLCGLIMFAALLLSSCSQNENTGTVTFTISQEVSEKITAGSARTVTYSGASESEIFMDIVLQSNGDYNEMATVKVAKGSSAEFKAVPANLTVYIEAKAYKLEKRSSNSQLRTDLYEGKSSEIIVQGGENNLVSITLIKLPVDDSEPQETPTPAKEDTTKKDDTSNNQTNNPTESGSATDNSGSGTTESSTSGGNTDTGSSSSETTQPTVTTADYTVREWKQTITDSGYQLAEETTLTGNMGSQTTAAAATYTGFTLHKEGNAEPVIEQQTIAEDGSTIVNIYYDRLTYTVTYNQNGHTSTNIPATTTYRYGAKAQTVFDTTDVSGWSFGGWFTDPGCASSTLYDSTTEITEPVTLYAKWIKESDSEIVVQFNYYSTDINITRTEDDDYITFTAPQSDSTTYQWWFEGSQDGDEHTYRILKDNLVPGEPYDLVLYLTNNTGKYSAFVQIIIE